MRKCFMVGVIFLSLSVPVIRVSAAEKILHLQDYINHQWSHELISYSLTFESGTCRESSITFIGAEGHVPFQLSDIEYDKAGFVRSARLSFLTDLPALGEKVFTLHYGPEPVKPVIFSEADILITEHSEYVEFTTHRAGVRVLSGEKKYESPVPAENVPGPVITLRTLEGKWFGGSSLYGKRKILGYRTTLCKGPVFAETEVCYTYEDGATLIVTVRVVAGQEVVFFSSRSIVHASDGGWRLCLSRGFDSPILSVRGEFEHNKWGLKLGEIGHVKLSDEPPGEIYNLVPWKDWWDGRTHTTLCLRSTESNTVLALGSYDPGAWVDPAWAQEYNLSNEGLRTFKYMPLVKEKKGDVSLQCSTAIGERKWFVGFLPWQGQPEQSYYEANALHDGKYGCQTLNMVKDYVLDWKIDPKLIYPRLYVSGQDVLEAKKDLSDINVIEDKFYRYYTTTDGKRFRLKGRELLQYMVVTAYGQGDFDWMRHGSWLVNLYDALMGSGFLPEDDQRLLRAQVAFLGYTLSSPYTWDIDRGFNGDINNMHLSYMCNLGLVACALPDHPQAQRWIEQPIKWVKHHLKEGVGEKGVWLRENLHYANVSLGAILPFAIAAKNAGFHKFLQDENLKAWAMYIARQLTPRDPRYENLRSLPPETRQDRAERSGLLGVIAKAMVQLDPDYSKVMQWAWNEEGNIFYIPDGKMVGFEDIVVDKSLPAVEPEWKSEYFPKLGAVMRHGFGTPDEYYLVLPLFQFGDYYVPQPGGLTIYAKGKPLAMVFSGVYEVCTAESFLTNRVDLARTPPATVDERGKNVGYVGKGEVIKFSGMPRQDYVAVDFYLDRPLRLDDYDKSKLPPMFPQWPRVAKEATGGSVSWRRQVLFVKGAQAHDANYFLIRDTVTGGQPTVWNFWTLSQKIGTPEETKNLNTFLSDTQDNKIVPVREIKGDRFTAIGQFDVDIEYYVSSPTNAPRNTLRWGYDTNSHWPNPWHEYQDLLHLQLTGDGTYYVAFFPRRREESIPTFETLGDGMIIKTKGTFGTDYGFLSFSESTAHSGQVRFSGIAGSVQDRTNELVMSLGTKGTITYENYYLASDEAASVCIVKDNVMVTVPEEHNSQTITLGLPRDYTFLSTEGNIQFQPVGENLHRIIIPEDVCKTIFIIQKAK